MPTLLFSLAALLWLPQAAAPGVGVETLSDGHYRLSVTMESADPTAAQRLILPKAEVLCGTAGYSLGRYMFESSTLVPGETGKQPDSVTLKQEVICGGPPPAIVPAPSSPPTRPPADQAEADHLNARIVEMSERFFTTVEAGRAADAFALMDPEMIGQSLEQWTAAAAAERDRNGALVSRQIARLTIYVDPDGVEPGLYIAADYVAGWEHQDECGYLVWHGNGLEGPFLLSRQERTFLPHDLPAAHRAALRQQACIIL